MYGGEGLSMSVLILKVSIVVVTHSSGCAVKREATNGEDLAYRYDDEANEEKLHLPGCCQS